MPFTRFFYFSSISDKNQLNSGYQSSVQISTKSFQLSVTIRRVLLQEMFTYFGFCFMTSFVLYFRAVRMLLTAKIC